MKGREAQSASYSLPSWGIGFDQEPQKAVMDNLRYQLRMFGTQRLILFMQFMQPQ